jgi:hypothetical protein
MTESQLPPVFADLQTYVDDWGLPTEKERFEKRVSSDLDTVRVFNDALFARIDEIIAHLDKLPLDEIAGRPADAALLNLALAYMETSHPVDLDWKATDLEDAFTSARFEFLSPSR